VLQAGAFFGALGSAPISGGLDCRSKFVFVEAVSAKIGRKTTLLGFTFIFLIGAVSADHLLRV
jgi:hypothetical protein